MIQDMRNELRLKHGFVMIGMLQQTQPPAVLPEALFVLREAAELCFRTGLRKYA